MSEITEYDVVVVGARVAGSSLAQLLARRGHRVLVVDREEFPSDTLSTHFMLSVTVPYLERLGVLADLLEAGFRRIERHRIYMEDCHMEGPAGPGGAFSLAPRRNVLDSALIDRAVEAGAAFEPRSRVVGLLESVGRVCGVRVASAGGEREIRARIVIGADGKQSKVAEWVGTAKYNEVAALRPVYYGYYHGVAPLGETALELFFGGDQVGFLFPMRPNEDCLALEVQPEEFEAFRAGPQATFEARFRALPGMEKRMSGARLEGKLLGTKGVDNYFRVPYGAGWALTGDAAYLKDPVTGLGIGDALAQGLWLSDALAAYLDGADWETTMAAFQAKRDAAMLPFFHSTLAFAQMRDRRSDELDTLRAICSLPSFSRIAMSGLPDAIRQMIPVPSLARLEAMAGGFGAARNYTKRAVIAGDVDDPCRPEHNLLLSKVGETSAVPRLEVE